MVEARVEFLRLMKQYERRMTKYSGPECDTLVAPILLPGEKEIVLVVHDECTIYAYEDEAIVHGLKLGGDIR